MRLPTLPGRSRSLSFALAASLAVAGSPGTSFGYAAGISGRSGKQGVDVTCSECHKGGKDPEVTIVGPAEVRPGSTTAYKVRIADPTALKGGFNAALSAGSLAPGAGTRLLNGEVTQVTPASFAAGVLAYEFQVTAPPTAGEVTLFAAANAVNANENDKGDRSSLTSFKVKVAGAPVTPAPLPDGGAMDPANPSPDPSGGGEAGGEGDGVVDEVPGEDGEGGGTRRGCSSTGGASLPMTGMMLGALWLLARRRRDLRPVGARAERID